MGPSTGLAEESDGEDRLHFADGVRLARRGEDLAALSRGRTRIADALHAAGDLLGTQRGVAWLVTDGRDTEGGALDAARALALAGHRLDVSAPEPASADVGIESVRVEAASRGGPSEFRARIASGVTGLLRVTLRRGDALVDSVETAVAPGATTEVVLRDPSPVREPVTHEVALTPLDGTPDDDPDDDRVRLVTGGGDPVLVLIDPEPWPAVDDAPPRLVSVAGLGPEALDAADLAVVSNVPWRRLLDAGAERLARQVASGATLLVLGGPQAYGPGGWRGTAFERLLPLRSPPPEPGDTSLVVAIDHSGSTGEEGPGGAPAALPSLLRALRLLLDVLPSDVRVTVLGFTDAPDAAPLAPIWVRGGDAAGRDALARSARRILPVGGTDLDRALDAAAALLAGAPESRRKRVLLMTDGDPDHALDAASFDRSRAALRALGAEVAAVVRGDARAAAALRTIATRPEDVVRIDAAGEFPEALLAAFHRAQSRDEVVDGPFEVVAAGEGPESKALGALRPSRLHRLEAVPGAEVLATAARPGEAALPFAASLRLGAGRVVALAGGPAHEAAADREAHRRALRPWLDRLASAVDRGIAGEAADGRLTAQGPSGLGSLHAVSRDGSVSARLVETSPGRYEGALPGNALPDGDWSVQGAGLAPRPIRMPARPPLEHRGCGVDEAALRALAAAGGGRRLGPGERPAPLEVAVQRSLAPVLLLLALALFLVERALAARAARASQTAWRGGDVTTPSSRTP
ncbi:MAG TPA: VWA domain-containing protein, partial [Planctomycetota bacterium]|nr:VWA domain-containing protein [Planctomycetota bacterium]